MSTIITTHCKMGIVDPSGNVNVLYPQTTGSDVSITPNATIKSTTVQGMVDEVAALNSDLSSQISNLTSDVSSITTGLAEKATKIYKNYNWASNHSFLSTGSHFYLVCVDAGDIAFIRQFSGDDTIAYTIFHYSSTSTTSPTSISAIRVSDGRIWIDLSVAKGCVVYEL